MSEEDQERNLAQSLNLIKSILPLDIFCNYNFDTRMAKLAKVERTNNGLNFLVEYPVGLEIPVFKSPSTAASECVAEMRGTPYPSAVARNRPSSAASGYKEFCFVGADGRQTKLLKILNQEIRYGVEVFPINLLRAEEAEEIDLNVDYSDSD